MSAAEDKQYSWSRTFKGKESVLRDLFGVVRERTTGTRKTIPLRFVAEVHIVVIEGRGEMTSKAGVSTTTSAA